MSQRKPTAAAMLVLAAVTITGVTGCMDGSAPHESSSGTPRRTSTSSATAAPTTSPTVQPARYISAGRSHGVMAIHLPQRYRGKRVTGFDNIGVPTVLQAGRTQRVSIDLFRGSGYAPAGLSVHAEHGDVRCGRPFLVVPGHAYSITCSLRPVAGRGVLTLVLHDATTGAAGARYSVHTQAR